MLCEREINLRYSVWTKKFTDFLYEFYKFGAWKIRPESGLENETLIRDGNSKWARKTGS